MEATPLVQEHIQKKPVVLAAIVAFIIGAVFLQAGIDGERAGLGLASNSVRSGASTFVELLGGLRTAGAAYLWIKLDRVHDTYYGDLSKEQELIPLYRIVTWLNPYIEDAYYEGSYMLCLSKQPDEGWKFALEGLRVNPNSWKLELNAGQLALFYRGDYKAAIAHLERAYPLAREKEDKILTLHGLKAAYLKAGKPEKAKAIDETVVGIDANLAHLFEEDDHDH